jgi:hypothetical protein
VVVLLEIQLVVFRFKCLEAFTTVISPNTTQVQGSPRQAFLTFVSIPDQCMVFRDDGNRSGLLKRPEPFIIVQQVWGS